MWISGRNTWQSLKWCLLTFLIVKLAVKIHIIDSLPRKNDRSSYPLLMRSKVKYWPGTPNSLRKGFQSDSICIKEAASGLQLSLFFKQIMFWLGGLFVFADITFLFLIGNRDVDNILSQKFKPSSPHILELYLQKFDFTSTFWIANCPYWWDVFGVHW